MLIKHKVQVVMSLFSLVTVPIPIDAETYLGNINDYVLISLSYEYMTITSELYIPLEQQKLLLCKKMGAMYYCENSCLLRHRSRHTCPLAIYISMTASITAPQCNATHLIELNVEPTILDEEQFVLLN